MENKVKLIGKYEALGLLADDLVKGAFEKVHREQFVLPGQEKYAYDDNPLPIGSGQTISQPYTVVFMLAALKARRGDKILDVGTGSGYQAALLSEIVGKRGKVISIERIPELVEFARKNLAKEGYNVKIAEGDGSRGYEKEAPYDRIIAAASASEIPEPLVKQLKHGGRMVIPVGQELYVVEKNKEIRKTVLGDFVFVPLVKE